jgi:5-methylcytosine-specific restriction endonuclease McrA
MPNKRGMLYQVAGGHCEYCGKKINYKEMQVDHIIPKHKGGNNSFGNMRCSCRMCNHYKRGFTVEEYRKNLQTLTERLNKIYIYRVGVDHGIITENNKPIKFYFER